jgi:hypothetical protein
MRSWRLGVPPDFEFDSWREAMRARSVSTRLALIEATHRELGTMLDRQELDAAWLSTLEYSIRANQLELIPGLALVTRGADNIGKLDTAGPLDVVRTLVGPTEGHTALAVAVLTLAASGHRASLETVDLESPPEPTASAAIVRCGRWRRIGNESPNGTIDLAARWQQRVGSPLVWSVCAGVPGRVVWDLYRMLHHVRSGLTHRADHRAERPKLRLGRDEFSGLIRFLSEAAECGVIPRFHQPRFVPRQQLAH